MEKVKIIRALEPKIKKIRVLEEVPIVDTEECLPDKIGEDIPVYKKEEEEVQHSISGMTEEEKIDVLEKEESKEKIKERHPFAEEEDLSKGL